MISFRAARVLALGVLWTGGCSRTADAPADTTRDLSETLPVFPGAEGFGSDTVAGRGGEVLKVTTLADDGPGSLRAALTASGPRTVVFEVGGVIALSEPISIEEPFLTLAGQTAPSPGVTLFGAGLVVRTHDVLVQHVRVRVGDQTSVARDLADSLTVNHASEEVYNVVVDHVSLSWAIDEVFSTWYPTVHDITVSSSVISEALSHAGHPKGEHSKGLLVGDGSQRVAVLGNLMAHNRERNPLLKGATSALVVNNLVYDPGNGPIGLDDYERSGPILASVVGNVVLDGPSSAATWPGILVADTVQEGTRLFVSDNLPAKSADPWSAVGVVTEVDVRSDEPPIELTPLTVRPSADVQATVLGHAGARPWDRDAVDLRVIGEVGTRGGHILDSIDEVGGLPTQDSTRHALTVPGPGDADGDGYTDVEEWIWAMEGGG